MEAGQQLEGQMLSLFALKGFFRLTSGMILIKTQDTMSPRSDRNYLYLDFSSSSSLLSSQTQHCQAPLRPFPCGALCFLFSLSLVIPAEALVIPLLGGNEKVKGFLLALALTHLGLQQVGGRKTRQDGELHFLLCKQGVACLPTSVSQHRQKGGKRKLRTTKMSDHNLLPYAKVYSQLYIHNVCVCLFLGNR